MGDRKFEKTVEAILRDDNRYAAGAYTFVRMGLDYTVNRIRSQNPDSDERQVSTSEFLDGIRRFALESFGPMALPLLEEWGVRSCADIGQIVFNLIDANALKKGDDDKIEDFYDGYDFRDAFEKPFLPRRGRAKKNAAPEDAPPSAPRRRSAASPKRKDEEK